MPNVVRRGRPVVEPRSRLLRFERRSTLDAVATTFGVTAADAATLPLAEPDPRHELARLALDLVVRTAEPIDAPRRWTTPAFSAEVDGTRAQLAPIRSRTALIASFRREASVSATRGQVTDDLPAGPVRIAYAIRWLELGDERARPTWPAILAGAVVDVVGSAGHLVGAHRNGEITR